MDLVKISVITICYQDFDGLCKTLGTVEMQTAPVYEHIIVAKSLRETEIKHLTKHYASQNRKFIFNQDKSLYNAMNIGLDQASGDYTYFLNSGDYFFDRGSYSHMSDVMNTTNGECACFRTLQVDSTDPIGFVRPGTKRFKLDRVPFGHQGFVSPRETTTPVMYYDETNRISADSAWMKRKVKAYGAVISKNIIAVHELGGVSNLPSLKSIKLRFRCNGLSTGLKEATKFMLLTILGRKLFYRLLMASNKYDRCDR